MSVYKEGFGFSAEDRTDPAADFKYEILVESIVKNG